MSAEQIGKVEQLHEDAPLTNSASATVNRVMEYQISCERADVAKEAIQSFKRATTRLGIEELSLPAIDVVFKDETEPPNLGRVAVKGDGSVCITFDKRFSTKSGERDFVESLHQQGIEYPGVQQVLAHEFGHIAMWSFTGMQRQPATRLLDEGWARMIEDTGDSDEGTTLEQVVSNAKRDVLTGLADEKEAYERCLDFSKVISQEEASNLGAAEYATGKALILYIREKYGKEALIRLLQIGITSSRRNDDVFEPATVDKEVHGQELVGEYAKFAVQVGQIDNSELERKALSWESSLFHRALLQVTGEQTIEEVRNHFLQWLRG